jgi:hypothetical protein
VIECDALEADMDASCDSTLIAAISDVNPATALPVPPSSDTVLPEGSPLESVEDEGVKFKKKKMIISHIDPPRLPKQVEIGRRAQVQYPKAS